MADQVVIGKKGRVTCTIKPDQLGEVMIPIRGGVEAFSAQSFEPGETLTTGTAVYVVEYLPPRTVFVSPM